MITVKQAREAHENFKRGERDTWAIVLCHMHNPEAARAWIVVARSMDVARSLAWYLNEAASENVVREIAHEDVVTAYGRALRTNWADFSKERRAHREARADARFWEAAAWVATFCNGIVWWNLWLAGMK